MIDKKPFGRTGHDSTRVLFGAAALGSVTQAEADSTIDILMDYGVNHFDTAHSYGDAELRLGPWLEKNRDRVFLATKTEKRTYDGAWAELRQSLERMRVETIDLWQMHFLVDEKQWQTAMGPGGALEAFQEAREQGIVRYLGVTGHDLVVGQFHKRSLERFEFDSILLPYNYLLMQNPQYAADFEAVVAQAKARNTAVQTIKSIAQRPWREGEQNRNTWYKPLEDQAEIDTAVHWVLGNPDVFLNSAGDITILPRVLDAASRFDSAAPRAALETTLAALLTSKLEPIFT